jgi:hypothetical protein
MPAAVMEHVQASLDEVEALMRKEEEEKVRISYHMHFIYDVYMMCWCVCM